MPGFEVPDTEAVLDFHDGPWAGAEVRVRLSAPLATYFDLLKAVDSNEPAMLLGALRTFAEEVLIDWNLTKKGERIPPTADGFMRLGLMEAVSFIHAWLRAVPAIDPTSSGRSRATGTSGRPTRRQRSSRPSS